MKVEEQSVATFNVGRKETAVAQIQASAKAFEILSSGLYSDAEFAIVREIGANAWDSHKAAGCTDKPFCVQIPTLLDPRFCVRDFGTGMTHEFMMTRVNTYFDSTKNDSNDEIGGFGLGIKSVFSYTSSFMIACYMDGTRRVYVYQIGEKGLPEISLMAETETTEVNGVEVSIPVKEEDYQKFRNAVQKTFAFYDVKPEVAGVELTIPEFAKVLTGSNWFISGKNDVFPKEAYVEMGGIAYPIDDSLHDLRYYARGQSLFLQASIGEIDITPNREQVKLTDRTRKFIKTSLENVKQEIFDIVQARVDDQNFSNYWEMIESISPFRNDMTSKLGFDQYALAFNGKKYDGKTFSFSAVPAPSKADPMDPNSAIVPSPVTGDMVPGFVRYAKWELRNSDRIQKDREHWNGNLRVSVDRMSKPYPIVVMEDRQGLHVSRWMKSAGVRNVIIAHAAPGTSAQVAAGIKDKLEGLDTVYVAADLTYDKTLFQAAGGSIARKMYIYHSGTWDSVTRSEVDMAILPATMYYFETDGRQKGTVFGREVDFKHNSEFVNASKSWLGENGVNIYYLTDAMIKKIQKHRSDITMVKAEDRISEILVDKVKEAGNTYFSNSLESIHDTFAKGNTSGWRTGSAVAYWAKTFGLKDYFKAAEDLKGHQADTRLEKMCKLIKGKTIYELFDEFEITVKTVNVESFEEMNKKMPYAYSLIDNYAGQEIIDHIATTMGWTIDQPVKIDDLEDYD